MSHDKFTPKSISKKFKWPKHVNQRFVTPLFPTDVYFVTSREDFADIDRYMKQRELGYPEDDFESAGGLTANYETTNGLLQIICVFDGYGLEILCHEVGHAALNILEGAGHITTAESSEPLCYLQQWLFKQGEEFVIAAELEAEVKRRETKAEPKNPAEHTPPEPAKKRSETSKGKGGRRGRR